MHATAPDPASTRRLSATQRLMLRGLGFLSIFALLCGAVGGVFQSDGRGSIPYTGTAGISELTDLRSSFDVNLGETEMRSLRLDHANAIVGLTSRFRVAPELAAVIYDEAARAGLNPEMAFRLVAVESNFNPRAHSNAAAFGLAQVQLPTARHYDPRITEKDLYEPRRNLRIGFRYLRDLSDRYGNMRMALLAYNVGPNRLQEILDGGWNPREAYATAVLKGPSTEQRTDLAH